ncbi:MAG TPA: NADH-ubiquinone oxidoreductase-F iron-sulfur binding region domain-containing protein [Spirochaetota bacterium]|nr:NADH-ubiquinone oxidoreductase-F iron-sulfur binding region domain-containing protein [Spirochaetota bacterium]
MNNNDTEKKDSNQKEEIIICSNSACLSSGGIEVFIYIFMEVFNNPSLSEKYVVKKGGCHGFCELGPTAIVGKDKIFYIKLDVNKAKEIIDEHLLNGRIVEKYLFFDTVNKKRVYRYDDLQFFQKQKRILLKTSPFVDPESLDDYIANGGFKTLEILLDKYDPFKICDMIEESGLRGRGGGGFITGKKWRLQAEQISQPKYVICNGDEGDPGTFMDKYLLEGDPYRILEGILIAGYATMSNIGIVYLRKEYDIAVKRVENAIRTLYDRKILGNSVMGRLFAFDIRIEYAPGAYISGEETALIAAIESKRGNPRVKPPYPVEKGLFNSPTLINNVETFANIREIINMGIEEYKNIGTKESTGTKLFTLSGSVRNSGLVEMPFGVTFNELINEIGGGMLKVSKLKAIQIGGASGGILPASLINEEISFENLKKLDASLGAGGIVVLDEFTCIVEMARYYLEFAQSESCGFCVPCREGTQKLLKLIEDIIEGNGTLEYIDKIKNISEVMYETSLCGLGRESINPVMSMLKYFEDELIEHIVDKKCRAGVCPKLVRYSINPQECIGCGACKLNCPVNAISGISGQYHTIDKELCIRCGQCFKICPKDAIIRS